MDYYEALRYTIRPEEEGMLLKTVLMNRLGVSRKLLSRVKQTEQGLTINGERVYTTVRVRAGDLVELRMAEEESDDILPEAIPLNILYEDDHLLIVNKPAGQIVHPTHGHYTGTLANAVVHHWRLNGVKVRFRPIHRLDQDTSGALCIAKNPYVHQQLSEQLQAGQVDKEYVAFVHGTLNPVEGTVDAPIDRDPEHPHIRIVTPAGYPSVTHYATERSYGHAASKVRLRLETGRTHQIRVHMRYLGHPLIGDAMYGLDSLTEPPAAVMNPGWDAQVGRHALHAARLAFTHPGTQRPVEFHAPLPDDLMGLERLLEQRTTGGE